MKSICKFRTDFDGTAECIMQEGNLGYGSHFQGSRWQAKKTPLNIFQVQSFLIEHKLGFNNEVTKEEPEKLTLT